MLQEADQKTYTWHAHMQQGSSSTEAVLRQCKLAAKLCDFQLTYSASAQKKHDGSLPGENLLVVLRAENALRGALRSAVGREQRQARAHLHIKCRLKNPHP